MLDRGGAPVTGDEIRQLRKDIRVSRPTLAYLLGVDPRTVTRWESGAGSPTGLPLVALVTLREAAGKSAEAAHRLVVDAQVNGLGRTLRDILAIVYDS